MGSFRASERFWMKKGFGRRFGEPQTVNGLGFRGLGV